MASCDYYRGRGSCSYGCRDEPHCHTGEPIGGWRLWKVKK